MFTGVTFETIFKLIFCYLARFLYLIHLLQSPWIDSMWSGYFWHVYQLTDMGNLTMN